MKFYHSILPPKDNKLFTSCWRQQGHDSSITNVQKSRSLIEQQVVVSAAN